MNNPTTLWIRNPSFDLFFFCAFWWVPLTMGLFYFKSTWYLAAFFVLYHLFIRIPHFLATLNFTFSFKPNHEFYKKHWIKYGVLPLLILLAFSTRRFFDPQSLYSRVLLTVALVWGTQHVAFQNFGILSIYRGKSAARGDVTTGRMEKFIFLLLTGFLVYKVLLATWMESLYVDTVVNTTNRVFYVLILIALSVYLLRAWLHRNIRPVSLPTLAYFFSALAVSFYWPFYDIVGGSSSIGGDIYFFVINGHHSIAYLGLIFHMSRNDAATRSSEISFSKFYFPLLVASTLLMGFVLLKWRSAGLPFESEAGFDALAILEGMFMTHYYLESVTWKFSNPHIRKTLLPLMKSA